MAERPHHPAERNADPRAATLAWCNCSPPNPPSQKARIQALRSVLASWPVRDGYAQNSTAVAAGTPLYLAQRWSITQPAGDLAVSLRRDDAAGRLAAEQDAPFTPPSATWPVNTTQRQSFALPVGVSTRPGEYTLGQVVYSQANGAALSLPEGSPSADGQRLRLGTVTGRSSSPAPSRNYRRQSRTFDYLELIEARLDCTNAQPGETLHAALFWRPWPNSYRDTYQAVRDAGRLDGSNGGDVAIHARRRRLSERGVAGGAARARLLRFAAASNSRRRVHAHGRDGAGVRRCAYRGTTRVADAGGGSKSAPFASRRHERATGHIAGWDSP